MLLRYKINCKILINKYLFIFYILARFPPIAFSKCRAFARGKGSRAASVTFELPGIAMGLGIGSRVLWHAFIVGGEEQLLKDVSAPANGSTMSVGDLPAFPSYIPRFQAGLLLVAIIGLERNVLGPSSGQVFCLPWCDFFKIDRVE